MRLIEFRVQNYRSVIDSSPVRVEQRAAIVGRNESGKTNLMMALSSLNPPAGIQELSFVRDFPRDREVEDYTPELRVVDTIWALDRSEQRELAAMFPRARDVCEITVGRSYAPTRFVGLRDLPELAVDQGLVDKSLGKLRRAVLQIARQRGDDKMALAVEHALERLTNTLNDSSDPQEWAAASRNGLTEFRRTLINEEFDLPDSAADALAHLEDHQESIEGDHDAQIQAMNWLVERLPYMVYLNDIPELDGHINLSDLAQRIRQDELTLSDHNFLRLARVAGFDPLDLLESADTDHQRRQQMVTRAGSTVTRKFRKLWSDRPIRVRFNLDGDRFDILISDPTAVYDMEVNLNERSRGFRWFFSLYVVLAADTANEEKGRESILLLDEPGLHLHALGQKDLLEHFARGFHNQIIFATHSPFMIPVEELHTVRTVSFNEEDGTVCSNKPKGDPRTLYPLQVAMAYASDEGLFGEQPVVMVPEMHEYMILGAVSAYLTAQGRTGLAEDTAMVPMGGLDRGLYMLTTFSDDNFGLALVINDSNERWEQLRALVDDSDPVLEIGRSMDPPVETGCGVDDLICPKVYDKLVHEAFAKPIGRKKLKLDKSIPDIVSRYSAAFEERKLVFQPMRVAAVFMKRMIQDPESVMTDESAAKFEALFERIDERLG